MKQFKMKLTIIMFVCLRIISQVDGEEFSLVCPKLYEIEDLAWYTQTDTEVQSSAKNAESKEQSSYACIICGCNSTNPEVEICIGAGPLRKDNLNYTRGFISGTITEPVWLKSKVSLNGVRFDLENNNLSRIIETSKVITESSSQSLYLNCPESFLLKRLEARNQSNLCIICSDGNYFYTSCINNPESCPWNHLDSHSQECLMAIQTMTNSNACGIYLSPLAFLENVKYISKENLKLDCPGHQVKG